ncbi:MalM family protein [Marinobacter sp. MDS2]|uniref:MalM family protein n=1 Tax=Marinobacter sp. MDS2 TaxID=3065961 RepID=UPI00273A769A|nr:MalM family protein [Marinobacter sp. MDS2]MDP4546587.1 MalM family protein [Marinobacter sp. MDS2]
MKLAPVKGLSILCLTATLMAGCQLGGGSSSVAEREGYFTWVDEQGRVRYTRIPESDASVERAQDNDTGGDQTQDPFLANTPPNDADYTAENYPDGDALADKGFVRDGQRQPYFTWLDAQGNVRVSYYTPDFNGRQKGHASPVNLTPASVHLPSQSVGEIDPVEGYDPNAFAVLGIEQQPASEFDDFVEYCCAELANKDYQTWVEGSEFGVQMDSDTPRHLFNSGESPYQLIALPLSAAKSGFVMRLRAYDHHGVFVPSLAFLDRDFRVVRVVTDLVMDYTPENWHRRGYLEAWVPALPGQGERWLVLYTRSRDSEGQTVITTDAGPKAIAHADTGELGIATFEP